jgi:hypothetical protein
MAWRCRLAVPQYAAALAAFLRYAETLEFGDAALDYAQIRVHL